MGEVKEMIPAEWVALRAEIEALKRERDGFAAALESANQRNHKQAEGIHNLTVFNRKLYEQVAGREDLRKAIAAKPMTHETMEVLTDSWSISDKAILEAHDAKVKHESSQATMEWALRALECVLLHPQDLERPDDAEPGMQAWEDLRGLLKRVLPVHNAALSVKKDKQIAELTTSTRALTLALRNVVRRSGLFGFGSRGEKEVWFEDAKLALTKHGREDLLAALAKPLFVKPLVSLLIRAGRALRSQGVYLDLAREIDVALAPYKETL